MNYFENLGKDKARPRGYVLGPSGTSSLRERFDLTYLGSFDASGSSYRLHPIFRVLRE